MNDKIYSITGGKGGEGPVEKKLPTHQYVLFDRHDEEYNAEGFLIFTTSHVAIMRDEGEGAVPVLLLPMDLFKSAEIDEDEAPF